MVVWPSQALAQPSSLSGHSRLHGLTADLAAGGPAQDQAPHVFVDDEELVDPGPPAVPGTPAAVAALASDELDPRVQRHAERLQVGRRRRVSDPARGANAPDQALGQHGLQDRRDQVRLGAHVLQSGDGARCVVGVQRGEDQVAGERGLDGDFHRLQVANLTHQDHVGVLANDVAQPGGEGEADLRLDRDLVHALQLVLHWILDRDDLALGRVDLVERAIQGRRLAGAGRSGDQNDAVRPQDELLEMPERLGREAQTVQGQEHRGAIEQPHHDGLAVDGGHGGHPDVDAPVGQRNPDAAILGQSTFRDVHLGHQLDA